MVALKASLIWRNHGYIGVSSSRNRMVRGNGSAGVETDVKATARPKTMRITMRRGPLHDTLDNNLSTITITAFFVRDARGMERKEVVDQTFRALSRQLLMASASNGFLSRHTAPMAAAL